MNTPVKSSKSQLGRALLFMLPALVIFGLFYYKPLVQNAYLSFFQWNMISPDMKYVGGQNYQEIFASTEFAKILGNTFTLAGFLLIFNFLLPYVFSFVLAYLVQNEKLKTFYRSALFLPSTISLAVASIIFLWMYNPLAGPVSLILHYFGVESPRWFKEDGLVIFAIATIIGWKAFGYNLIVLLAAMVAVPRELIEAARLEDASNWTIFLDHLPEDYRSHDLPHRPLRVHHYHYLWAPVYAGAGEYADPGRSGPGKFQYCLYRLPIRPGVFPDRQIRSLCHAVYGSVFDFPGAEDPVPGQTCPLRKLKGGCHEKTICGHKPPLEPAAAFCRTADPVPPAVHVYHVL